MAVDRTTVGLREHEVAVAPAWPGCKPFDELRRPVGFSALTSWAGRAMVRRLWSVFGSSYASPLPVTRCSVRRTLKRPGREFDVGPLQRERLGQSSPDS
jgi:hypothetical protein